MVAGFNHDFIYKGTKFHLQAEDCGSKLARIVTHLFKDGSIIASRKTSYADILTVDNLDKVVQELMKDQARDVLHSLRGGEYDDIIYGVTEKGELIREKAVLHQEGAAGIDGAKDTVPLSSEKKEEPGENLFAVVSDESDPLESIGLGLQLEVPWWDKGSAGEEEPSGGGLQLAAPWWEEEPGDGEESKEEPTSSGGLELAAPWWEMKPEDEQAAETPAASGEAKKSGKAWWKKKQ
ncbi:MAG: hypothetical protein GX751_05370 [Desulfuromonadaceae bacterium]|nr:hypothetical protein [Desulfuromonadaceae bacterium]